MARTTVLHQRGLLRVRPARTMPNISTATRRRKARRLLDPRDRRSEPRRARESFIACPACCVQESRACEAVDLASDALVQCICQVTRFPVQLARLVVRLAVMPDNASPFLVNLIDAPGEPGRPRLRERGAHFGPCLF